MFWTCEALIRSRIISTRAGVRAVKGWRLAAIVHRMRSDYGWPIQTEYRGAADASGGGSAQRASMGAALVGTDRAAAGLR